MKTYNSVNPHKLYRNQVDGIIGGVCAGLADYFGISRGFVRFLTFIGLLINAPLIIAGYVILIFILDKKPARIYASFNEEQFWRGVSFSPKSTFSGLRHKFRTMDERLRKMEDYVTSREYELKNKYKNI